MRARTAIALTLLTIAGCKKADSRAPATKAQPDETTATDEEKAPEPAALTTKTALDAAATWLDLVAARDAETIGVSIGGPFALGIEHNHGHELCHPPGTDGTTWLTDRAQIGTCLAWLDLPAKAMKRAMREDDVSSAPNDTVEAADRARLAGEPGTLYVSLSDDESNEQSVYVTLRVAMVYDVPTVTGAIVSAEVYDD